MEKFGIFNILSALGNLSNGQTDEAEQAAAPQNGKEKEAQTAAQTAETGIFTGEERMNKMLGVLERHEQISKRIDKNNKCDKPPR